MISNDTRPNGPSHFVSEIDSSSLPYLALNGREELFTGRDLTAPGRASYSDQIMLSSLRRKL